MADDDEMFVFSREDLNWLRRILARILRWQRNFRGDGVKNSADGATISQQPGSPPPPFPTERVALLMLTGNVPAGGKYNLKVITGRIAPTEATWTTVDLNMPETGLVLPQDENGYGINLIENGENTHALTASTTNRNRYHFGFRWGTHIDGKPIYVIGMPAVYDPSEE